MQTKLHDKLSAIQVSFKKIMLSKSPLSKIIELDSAIKAFSVSSTHFVVSTGSVINVFEHGNCSNIDSISSFSMSNESIEIDSSSLYIASKHRVDVCNFQGIVKGFVKLDNNDGEINRIDLKGSILLISTLKFVVKVYDVSRREPKLLHSKRFVEFVSIVSVAVNFNGSFLSIFAIVNGILH